MCENKGEANSYSRWRRETLLEIPAQAEKLGTLMIFLRINGNGKLRFIVIITFITIMKYLFDDSTVASLLKL